MPTPLLKTKLYIPPAQAHLVSRPRLIHQLNEGLRRKLILVSAPPGFGKTTLISSWLAEKTQASLIDGPKVAWVSLDKFDNDPVRFWSYAIAALETIQAEVGENVRNLLYSPQSPPIETILTGLINNLVNLPSPLVLALDDYHLVENPDIHQGLAFLLDHLPPQVHLALISRADPPLPLTRLRVRGQLVELRAGDLRFTSTEVATFLNQMMGLNLAPADIMALEARTEGWIAGLQLAALSMQGQADTEGFVQAFAGSHRYIIDYLVEEVLARQPEHLQKFLLHTSILQRLCGPLCDTLLNGNRISSGQDILIQLEQANLFLIPLDDKRRWYRYHHLFADVLRERLQTHLSEAEIVELHRRASAWYAGHDLISEAISHALAAGDVEQAGHLIEQVITPILIGGQITTVVGWLTALPESLILSRPRLSLSCGWAMIIIGQWDKMETYLRAAEKALPPRSELRHEGIEATPEETTLQGLWGEAMAMRAMFLANRGYGDATHAVELCEQALEWVPHDNATVRSIILFILGQGYETLGNLNRASQVLTQAISLSNSINNLVVALSAINSLARLREEQGHIHEAVALQRQALEMVEKQFGAEGHPERLPAVASRTYMDMAETLREQNKLEQAKKFLTISLELGQRINFLGAVQLSYVVLARILQAQGDERGALEMIQQANGLIDPDWPMFHWVRAVQARLWLAQGNLAEAIQWVQSMDLPLGADFCYADYPGEYATLIRLWLVQERFEEALALLERMQSAAQTGGRSGRLVEILMLKALTLYAQGNPQPALILLAQALTLGEAAGYIRLFVDEGPPMARLLQLAKTHRAAPNMAYVNRLLAAFSDPPGGAGPLSEEAPRELSGPNLEQPDEKSRPPVLLVEPLSDRELEILYLVAAGLSNQDIAAQLVIAEGTVKKHLHNIFGKLEVRSRTQAIVRATELRLL